MTTYWCANFDNVDCFKHGLDKKLWLMQYQYKDDHGHVFQDGVRKGRIRMNWQRVGEVSLGDWLVAYLVLRLRVYGPSSHNYLAERCPDRLRLSVLRTWTDCRGGVRFGDPGRGTGRDSGRSKRTGKTRHVWPKNP